MRVSESDREVRRSQWLKDHAHTNSEKICDKVTSHRLPSNPLGQFLKKKEKKKKKKKKKKMENFDLISNWTLTVL